MIVTPATNQVPYVKVHVTLDPEQDTFGGESVWAVDLGGGRYRIDNIPFFASRLIAYGDVVEARDGKDASEHAHEFVRVVEPSGHQTLPVLFADTVVGEAQRPHVARLTALGCKVERLDRIALVVDFPATDAALVEQALTELTAAGVLRADEDEE